MFGRRVPLLRLFGFEIRFDLTWLILVALVIWTLSADYFPDVYRHLPTETYVWMGVLTAIGVIASVIIHELCHSLVARRFGTEIEGITLFAFGGAAELRQEPPTSRAEFFMAAAGPVASFVLAAALYLIATVLAAIRVPMPLIGVFAYLAGLNVILAVFNLIPAFPLDGGRLLRALLWARSGDLRRATRVAAAIGGGFGLVLVLLGIVNLLEGNLVGGMWYFLIGLFVRAAAASSYQQLIAREALGGVPVARVMRREPITVSPDARIPDLIENYFLDHNLKLALVIEAGRLVGMVDASAVKSVPLEARHQRHVRDILTPISSEDTIRPDTDVIAVLELMQRLGKSRLLVADVDRLAGIISLDDMLNGLTLRLDFADVLGPAHERHVGPEMRTRERCVGRSRHAPRADHSVP
jgi:Zn-dependent protease/predicted transcriptional regulator